MTEASVFNSHERAIQQRMGVRDRMDRSQDFIRSYMPEQHRLFFANLPVVLLTLVDRDGFPWVLPIAGRPGFVSSPDVHTLVIQMSSAMPSLMGCTLEAGTPFGLLGIELHSRRRNRLNGVVTHVGVDSLTLRVEQSFGNCKKFIHPRCVEWPQLPPLSFIRCESLIFEQLCGAVDTFFIASRAAELGADPRYGLDVSHRGGVRGFVRLSGDSLIFPDFSGNRYFNTVGNISSDPRVGLYFPFFDTGSAVFVKGEAKILWDHPMKREFPEAERVISVLINEVRVIYGVFGREIS